MSWAVLRGRIRASSDLCEEHCEAEAKWLLRRPTDPGLVQNALRAHQRNIEARVQPADGV